jgi:hypothetical protein
VVDLDHVAVARTDAGEADHAIGDGQDRIADVGLEVDALVELVAADDGIGAAAEAGGDVAVGDRIARGDRVAVELAVEQQRFHHRELLARRRIFVFERGQLALELVAGHVADRVRTTGRDRLFEIELAVVELAGAREALAECVEAVGLGLEFTQARGKRIDFALRVRARRGELGFLLVDLGRQVGVVRAGNADAGAEPQHEARSEENAGGDTRTALCAVGKAAHQAGRLSVAIVQYDLEAHVDIGSQVQQAEACTRKSKRGSASAHGGVARGRRLRSPAPCLMA